MENTAQSPSRSLQAFILAGGHGERLWPSSRRNYPKQFLTLTGLETTLFQDALRRAEEIGASEISVLCNEEHRFLAAQQALEIGSSLKQIILEPSRRDTAASIALAALSLTKSEAANSDFIILASDHLMPSSAELANAVKQASKHTRNGGMVVFGIQPSNPNTGYGYIKYNSADDNICPVEAFIEKPERRHAEEMIQSGNHLWNSGMLMASAKTYLAEAEQHSPKTFAACNEAFSRKTNDGLFVRVGTDEYSRAPAISADYAVLEKTEKLLVAPLKTDWSDAGTWASLYNSNNKDREQNITQGNTLLEDTKRSYIRAESRLVATKGLDDILVVETQDAVLVSKLSESDQLKSLVEKVTLNSSASNQSSHVHRPWGKYETVTDGSGYQVKRLAINSGMKISLQTHQHRSEHWLVVSGQADVTINGKLLKLHPTESVDIPKQAKHSVKNTGAEPLEIIEIQSGSYLGEDDIVRFTE